MSVRVLIYGLALLLFASVASGQVTAAKPSSPSLDTAETHFPDHLWLMNEGTGSTLEDDGDGGDYDLTCSGTTGGGPDWGTDATHGDKLTFVSSNQDKCINTSLSGLSGAQTSCVVANVTAGTGSRIFMSFTDSSQADRYAKLIYQGDEDIEASFRFDGAAAVDAASTQDGTGGFDMVCLRFSDSAVAWSLNGSAWSQNTGSFTGLVAALNTLGLGVNEDPGPDSFFNNSMIAAWWWNSSKSDADIAAIYNSGNPWPIIGVDSTSPPVFSAGPAVNTPTTTTIPTTFTLNQTGTVEGVACPDGAGAPSVTQVLADQCSGGGAAAADFDESVVGGVADSHTLTGLTAATTYDLHFAASATGGNSAAVSSVNNVTTASAGSPAFDVNIAVASQTASTYTISYDANAASANIFVGAYKKDSASPTCDNIEAGTGTGFVDNDTEATTGSSDSIVLTITAGDPFPVYDLYGCLEDAGGTTDSLVSELLDEFLDAPTGRQYVIKSGGPTGSQEGILDDASVAAVDGDVMDASAATYSFLIGESAHTFTLNADTTYEVDPSVDDSRQTITRRFYDVSAAAWSDASAVLYCINNQVPDYVGLDQYEGSIPYLFEKGVAASLFMDGLWEDPEDDALTHNATNLPTGLTEDGEELSGSPTTFGYYPNVTLEATDTCGDTADEVVQFVVGLRLPDVVSWLMDESLWKSHSIFTGAAANATEYDTYLPRAVNY